MFHPPGDDMSPRMLGALAVTRLANAVWTGENSSNTMRYIAVYNALKETQQIIPMIILDTEEGSYITVDELMDRLPEDLRKRALYS